MSLSLDDVRKVAHLARIQLTTEEEQKFAQQLNNILTYVEQLSELDVTDVEPTTRAIDVNNVMRTDRLDQSSDREGLLGCAPDRDDDFFKVPKIMNG